MVGKRDPIPEGFENELKFSGDLVVRASDPPHVIPSGSIVLYQNILIEKGTKLIVDGATKDWTELYAIKDFIVNGTIQALGFRTARNRSETVLREAYDGRTLSFTYRNDNKGGDGGQGGAHNHTDAVKPGDGARGTYFFGGGGTGWKNVRGQRSGTPQPGGNARENLGGQGGRGSGIGGKGVRRSDRGDGGLLYLSVGGRFHSKEGKVQIYGSDGADAQSGANGDAYRGGNGGGAGGGAPGNHGGCLIVSASIIGQGEWPLMVAHGGAGGKHGLGGSGWHQAGRPGFTGEDGNSGRFLPKRYISPL